MQRLETLWKLVNAASTVRDMAITSRVLEFTVQPPVTFYLHAEYAALTISRWDVPRIRVQCQLQAGFGWNMQTDQDEAGVYVVARRRPVVGSAGSATFQIDLPRDTHIVLRMAHCSVQWDDLNGEFHIHPDGRTDVI